LITCLFGICCCWLLYWSSRATTEFLS